MISNFFSEVRLLYAELTTILASMHDLESSNYALKNGIEIKPIACTCQEI
jgi:hypothetical protein